MQAIDRRARRPVSRVLAGGVAVWLVATPQAASAPPPRLPDRLERYLAETVKPGAADRQRLLRGEAFTRLLDADPAREVAVFGAIWVEASRHAYRDAVIDIEGYERGRAFPVTRRLGSPPQLADLALLRLPDDTLRDLRDCRVGDCAVKLGREAIDAIAARVDFGAPTARLAAEAILREQVLESARAYAARGNAGLVVYHDDEPPVSAAEESAALLRAWPSLLDDLPELRRLLTDYPHAPWPAATDFLYWQEVRFGLKPFVRLNHMVVHEDASRTVVATKMLYASHYFRAALEVRVLLPDPQRTRGYWLVSISRSRPDGLTGLIGRLIRGRIRSEARNGVQAMLGSAKARLERAATP